MKLLLGPEGKRAYTTGMQGRRITLSILLMVLSGACRPGIPVVPGAPYESRSNHEAYGRTFIIATQGDLSTKAAHEIVATGGNIVDAAVTASFAMSVERPQSTGIGGGGFMLIHFGKASETIAVDFRERAPIRASERMFQDSTGAVIDGLSTDGPLAVAVPGLVAGLADIHKKYGKLPWAKVIEPAIKLATAGVPVYPHLAQAIEDQKEILQRFKASRELFFRPDGTPLREGDLFRPTHLAQTLREIADKGRDGFYKGWVAKALLQELKEQRGLISQRDLDEYEVKYRTPVRGRFKGFDVVSMSPPSSGGAHVIQILNILVGQPLRSFGPYSAKAIHFTASAMQSAFADRATYLGDTDFVTVPLKGLTSPSYADKLRAAIPEDRARKAKEVQAGNPLPFESDNTTHFSMMDGEGNAIASTQTVNGPLGSGIIVPTAGFILNNEMDDFSAKVGSTNAFGLVGGAPNAIAPRKRPLSSMSPTIVLREGRPVFAVGSPSGSRIISCVVLTLLNYFEYGMPLYEAVSAVRYHHQWIPDEIRVDHPSFPPNVTKQLEKMGYKINLSDLPCRIQAVALEGDRLHGVSDPREEGMALGR